MANPMRIRAEIRDGLTEVRLLIPHPLESGPRKDENGAPIPAHFITALEIFHRERLVFGAEFGPSVSANPFLRFRFAGAVAGDRLVARWQDNRGDSRRDEATVAAAKR